MPRLACKTPENRHVAHAPIVSHLRKYTPLPPSNFLSALKLDNQNRCCLSETEYFCREFVSVMGKGLMYSRKLLTASATSQKKGEHV
jgi:hypothetical protein